MFPFFLIKAATKNLCPLPYDYTVLPLPEERSGNTDKCRQYLLRRDNEAAVYNEEQTEGVNDGAVNRCGDLQADEIRLDDAELSNPPTKTTEQEQQQRDHLNLRNVHHAPKPVQDEYGSEPLQHPNANSGYDQQNRRGDHVSLLNIMEKWSSQKAGI